MLAAQDQRLLRTWILGYVGTGLALLGDDAQKGGGCGPDRPTYWTDKQGVHWAWPSEPRDGVQLGTGRTFPHHLTWAKITQHGTEQPREHRIYLRALVDKYHEECAFHEDTSRAINPELYHGASKGQRRRLDIEFDRHMGAHGRFMREIKTVCELMLPLGTDEPADLIEWAEALS